jgi:hypothetical protein
MLVSGTGTEFQTTLCNPGQSSFHALALQLLSLSLFLFSSLAVMAIVSVMQGHADALLRPHEVS